MDAPGNIGRCIQGDNGQRTEHQARRPGRMQDGEFYGLVTRIYCGANRVDHRLNDSVSEAGTQGKQVERGVVVGEVTGADGGNGLQGEGHIHRHFEARLIKNETETDHCDSDRPERGAKNHADLQVG